VASDGQKQSRQMMKATPPWLPTGPKQIEIKEKLFEINHGDHNIIT